MKVFFRVFLLTTLCVLCSATAFADVQASGQANSAGTQPTQQEQAAIEKGPSNQKIEIIDAGEAFKTLERSETIVYGSAQSGALLPRLSNIEKEVFGRELPGSLTERQTAMLKFLEEGSANNPSLLYKVAVIEWGAIKKIQPDLGLARRLDQVEIVIEGTTSAGALATRTEKILGKILPSGTNYTHVTLEQGTVVKAVLPKTLTVRNCKVGDKITLNLGNEIKKDNIIIAPAGSRVLAEITKVKPPRSFGRSSVIEMKFNELETIMPKLIPLTVGEMAKKARETDITMAGAVGASFAGAFILGPVGLVSGVFIRGNDKQLKEGTVFYLETEESAAVTGYKIPDSIKEFAQDEADTPQGSGQIQPAAQ